MHADREQRPELCAARVQRRPVGARRLGGELVTHNRFLLEREVEGAVSGSLNFVVPFTGFALRSPCRIARFSMACSVVRYRFAVELPCHLRVVASGSWAANPRVAAYVTMAGARGRGGRRRRVLMLAVAYRLHRPKE
jgi:hypothetical protein